MQIEIKKTAKGYQATVWTDATKAVFQAVDRLSAFKMASSYAWERMK